MHSTDADTFDELVAIADRALFSAKHAGRDRVASHEGGRTFQIHGTGTPQADSSGHTTAAQDEILETAEAGTRLVTTSGLRTA